MSFQGEGDDEFTGIGYSSAAANTGIMMLRPTTIQQFVPAAASTSVTSSSFATAMTTNPDDTMKIISLPSVLNPSSSSTLEADAHAARLRAMEIVQKFQASGNNSNNNNINAPTEWWGDSIYDASSSAAAEWKRKRDVCLEQLHQREQRALLKNLEYLAKVEEDRLQQRLQQVEQAKAYEQQVHQQYQDFHMITTSSRRQQWSTVATCQSGIGTQQRQRVEQKRKRTTQNNSSGNMESSSVAVYVANLPPSADEPFLRNLFGGLGSIRKIHFYVDKETRRPKGDALVIYSILDDDRSSSSISSSQQLLEDVCSQLNGCELPGSNGKPLLVQPSDPLHKIKSTKTRKNCDLEDAPRKNDHSYYGPSSGADATVTKNNSITDGISRDPSGTMPASGEAKQNQSGTAEEDENEEDDDNNLDDFFSSLE